MGISKTYRNDGLEGRPTTIVTGVEWIIDPTSRNGGIQDYMSRHMPFNSLFIRNNDQQEIYCDMDGTPQRRVVLPQGATVTKLENFSFIKIKNNGSGTIATGNITVMIEKVLEKK